MFAAEAPLGCSALLRVAGLPIRYWLEGASPQLFGMVEALERSEKSAARAPSNWRSESAHSSCRKPPCPATIGLSCFPSDDVCIEAT